MSSNNALLGAIISLFFPGIGLILSRDNKFKGILVFIIAMLADFAAITIASILTLCVVGVVLFALPFFIHVLAAIHTHDVIVKEDNSGKPMLFN